MPTVAIPPSHFTKNVKKNYQSPNFALIREFVQNSVDAGSTKIVIHFDGKRLTVQDDGCGMNRDLLVKAMLTMSGSHKGANSIGGFGAAKEILLFQHESYDIQTCDGDEYVHVHGHQLEYEFVQSSPFVSRGTVISIVFHDDYELNEEFMKKTIVKFLKSCDTKPVFIFNGEEITECLKVNNPVKELDWCAIYTSDTKDDTEYIAVRINGVTMFNRHVGDVKNKIIIEITKPSTEILTVNRDGFTWSYSEKLNALIQEITIDKNSFSKLYRQQRVFRGKQRSFNDFKNRFKIDKVWRKATTGGGMSPQVEGVIGQALNQAHLFDSGKLTISKAHKLVMEEVMYGLRNMNNESRDKWLSKINHQVSDSLADFYVEVACNGYDEIPSGLKPRTMTKRHSKIIKLWKRIIKLVLECNGIWEPYAVGWILDNDQDTVAAHKLIEDVNVFLFNPLLDWWRSSNHNHVFHKMLIVACHEVAHVKRRYHDEYFADISEDYIVRTLIFLHESKNSWWKQYLAANEEEI